MATCTSASCTFLRAHAERRRLPFGRAARTDRQPARAPTTGSHRPPVNRVPVLRRNYFCLSPEQLLSVVTTCRQRLADDRPEIGTLAGSTLSGLMRVLPDGQLQALLADVLRDAARLFPQRRRQRPAAGATTLERQACALSLRSLLQSSPYQIKRWYGLNPPPPPLLKGRRSPTSWRDCNRSGAQ
jgi:hypothetical protein